MNCKNVEPLLSLYVGRDLEDEPSRLVAVHLQSCTECTLAADEYAAARQLLQRCEPPVFSDGFYAGIRGNVLNQIERESHARMWSGFFSQLFSALVQPRMKWITAALVLTISVTALYLSRKPLRQLPNDQPVAVRSETNNESAPSPLLSNKRQDHTAAKSRPINRNKKTNVRVVATNRSRKSDKADPSSGQAPLRVEMQTSNRNIRIIWLSGPRPGAVGPDGSKGI